MRIYDPACGIQRMHPQSRRINNESSGNWKANQRIADVESHRYVPRWEITGNQKLRSRSARRSEFVRPMKLQEP